MRLNRIALLSILVATPYRAFSDAVDDYAIGLKDSALKTMISTHFQPTKECERRLIAEIDSIDRLNGNLITDDSAEICEIVPSSWMMLPKDYATCAAADLHNLFITTSSAAAARGAVPFGNVTEIEKSCDGWKIGYAPYFTDIAEFIEPADELKGDFARAIFYIATIYPCSLWTGWGNVIMGLGSHPTLSNYASSIYLAWHRNDPVDANESKRNAKIAELQGNANPFVAHPILVEYLWGDSIGKTYGKSEVETPVTEFLQSKYSINDAKIRLLSPYIADNAVWSYNGAQMAEQIAPSDLGIGKHELHYTTSSHKGKIIITITE